MWGWCWLWRLTVEILGWLQEIIPIWAEKGRISGIYCISGNQICACNIFYIFAWWIRSHHAIPSGMRLICPKFILQHDNDTKHTAKVIESPKKSYGGFSKMLGTTYPPNYLKKCVKVYWRELIKYWFDLRFFFLLYFVGLIWFDK